MRPLNKKKHDHVLVAGAALLFMTLVSSIGDTDAQVFFVQGENGDSVLDCDGTTCTLNQNLAVTGDVDAEAMDVSGNLDVAGPSTMVDLMVDSVAVLVSYQFPECPQGYVRDTTRSDIVLCENDLGGGIIDQVVKVGSFWIDRYEISLWSSDDCTGTQYGLAAGDADTAGFLKEGNWDTPLYGCSIVNEVPSRRITWFQAQQACVLAGKRLCTNAEWQAAAQGTYDPGSAGSGGQCNISTGALRNTGQAGTTPAGSFDCISIWGAEDMVGNIWEWTAWWTVAGPQPASMGDGIEFTPWPSGYGEDSTWNVSGRAYDGSAWVDGIPAVSIRGGDWGFGAQGGVFSLDLREGASSGYWDSLGTRCCL